MKGKLFQQITSAAISTALVITGLPAVMAADAATDVVGASYDMSADTLSVNADLATIGKKMISVIVAPEEVTDYAPENLAVTDSVILKTIQTNTEGVADVDIIMPDGFAGRYIATLGANGKNYSIAFFDITQGGIDEMYAQFAAGNYAAVAPGLQSVLTDEADAAKIEEYVKNNIATVTDSASALNVYATGEAIARVMNSELALGDALFTYSQYVGEEYCDDFAKLTPAEQNKMNALFVANGNKGLFAEQYRINKFMAQYTTTDSIVSLGELVLDIMEEKEPELVEKYNDIGNNYYKEKVFDSMYSAKSQATDFAYVVAKFESEIAKQTKAYADKKQQSSGSGSGSSGSSGGTSSGTISTSKPAVDVPVQPQAVFTDIANHWAKASIENMFAKGVVNGVGDGSFKPDAFVTRAEFAKMIAIVLGLDVTADANFADVADNSWYNGYVAAVANAGIVKGDDAGNFNPELCITRQDAAVMLARALSYKGVAFDTASANFSDEASVAEYAKDSVNGMAAMGIITGYNGGFAPLDNTTRASAATLLERVSAHIG